MATHGSLAATHYTQNPQNAVKHCSSITTESKSMKCVHFKGGSSETHKQPHSFPVLLSSDILFFLMSHQGIHGRWRSPKRGIQNAISALLHCAAESLLLKSITAQKQTNNKPVRTKECVFVYIHEKERAFDMTYFLNCASSI